MKILMSVLALSALSTAANAQTPNRWSDSIASSLDSDYTPFAPRCDHTIDVWGSHFSVAGPCDASVKRPGHHLDR